MINWRELIKRVTVNTSVLLIALGVSCQQVKEIPEEIPEQLPNPVRGLTQNDRYVIGLDWYRQGNYDIAAKFWKPPAAEGDCDAQYAMGLLYSRVWVWERATGELLICGKNLPSKDRLRRRLALESCTRGSVFPTPL